ncbi:efflux RND transporter periplasmic adaptor subunit [Glaciimonas immobilis]|uniref:Membrane fusion protein (Multidrug efflux system) n=1 Tax=Glaciimonas immobilis TaxID=728004 RepID=A0A840RVS4_9BURK|nr:efflux RND transporter periplasmic adaptor subunit [Glaciimonas immobilis]KAF3998349.1 efflux RND transporter periplasmic adaptor subunit [Glaciimonas immobilis]MBB5201975.1 membrane fusion protein (multidrug efflux system) [Glaciimonas immobilis]
MTKRMLIMLGGVVLLIALLALGFFLHIRKLIASAPKPGAQSVSVATIKAIEWQPQLSSVGTMVAVRGVDVSTEIAGLVRTVSFKSGEDVKAGQLLVQLNADSDIAQLHALEANAELAASVLARDKQQLAVQAISQAQIDNDLADLKSKQALAAQQSATVAKKTIRAPFAGKLGITTINPGQYVNPGEKIVTLQTIDPIYVDFFIPQKQLSGLMTGQTLNLTNDAYADTAFVGKVTAISSKVDPATRNVQVEATVSNAKRQLLPGMFANVKVEIGGKKSYLTLPQTAITYNPYGSTVFVVTSFKKPPAQNDVAKDAAKEAPGAPKDGDLVVQQVFVTTGETRGDQVAILTGLKEGQRVVTSGQLKLKNNTVIVINNKVEPLDNPNPTPQEH